MEEETLAYVVTLLPGKDLEVMPPHWGQHP